MRITFSTGILVVAVLWPAAARADDSARRDAPRYGHSMHGPEFDSGPRLHAELLEGQGRVHFPVTGNPDAQKFMNQAVAQFHGFHWYECERSFREALHRDPDCVMALWGMAMAANGDVWLHKPVPRAQKLTTKALALRHRLGQRGKRITPRENAYLDALVTLMRTGSTRVGRLAFLDAMRAIVRAHPEDLEAKAFLVFSLLKHDDLYKPPGSNWLTRPSADFLREADALVDAVLAVAPDHPVHHYKIHIWDYHEPERAVGSTDPIGPSEPRIAHMWHMAGHIHWRARRFPEAAWQQEAGTRTDHRYYREQRIMPFLNPNYLHNSDWLTESLGTMGSMDRAMRLSVNMIELPRHPRHASFATSSGERGRDDLMDILNLFERWDEVDRLMDSPLMTPTESLPEETKRLRLRGLAHYHLGRRDALAADIKELGALRYPATPPATARNTPEEPDAPPPSSPRTVHDVAENVEAQREAWLELSAYHALLTGDRARALHQLRRMEPYVQPPIDWEDTRKGLMEHQLAQAFADAGDLKHAVIVARSAAKKYPGEVVPQAALVETLARAGRRSEAQSAYRDLARHAAFADLDAPVLKRLRDVHRLGTLAAPPPSYRWLKPAMHPSLESLGPLTWSPVDAPDARVKGPDGKVRAVSDYRGKPLLLVLNLGRGCAHCNRQLEALAQAAPRFTAAGIEGLVITDAAEDARARAAGTGTGHDAAYPFPIVPGSRRDVFRPYRAIDEFEDQPLHGVYLISPDGKILWEDVGADPYMDFGFLVSEARRLLAIWRPKA